jgi:hypothetical protein
MNSPECSSTDLIAEELIEVVESCAARLAVLSADSVTHKPSPARWSIQEVIGHLVDSASNNHQRFVRAQQADELVLPDYEQNFWVASQGYNHCDWLELLDLWRLYNRHLAHVIRRIPDVKMQVQCTIGPNAPVSLSYLVEDYLVHLKHHVNKIKDRIV